jgi:hypothetical protein
MNALADIDITYDFRSDTPVGKDPDVRSPTLRRYHRQLWSKPLPTGEPFDLLVTTPRAYLHHKSSIGEFFLSSDSVIPTFIRSARIAHITTQVPIEMREAFYRLGYTIGGMMIFPGNKVDRQMTINGARGCHYLIKDRFDLTIECIRRHYRNESSPLSDTLDRYRNYFRLFVDFRGYVEFFLLQDLVVDDFSAVKFFLPFEEFQPWPLPKDLREYHAYRQAAEMFLHDRNQRILQDARARRTDHIPGSFTGDV